MIFLSIDPSLRRLGWAVYDSDQGQIETLGTSAWNFGTLSPRAAEGRREKMESIRTFFVRRLTSVNPDHLIYEEPSFFTDARGAIAAKEGYTNDLCIVIGIAIGVFTKARFFGYKPQEWKGSVPKEVTYKKFLRTFTDSDRYAEKANHDLIDAIMILYYHLKQLKLLAADAPQSQQLPSAAPK